jgi:hypothetical protein
MGDLDITSKLDINGTGSGVTTIDASTLVTPDRVFDVQPEGRVALNGLRITGGHPMRSSNGLDGGGIRVFGGGGISAVDVIRTCSGTDQRSAARPQDGNADGIARCDIGAYELIGP